MKKFISIWLAFMLIIMPGVTLALDDGVYPITPKDAISEIIYSNSDSFEESIYPHIWIINIVGSSYEKFLPELGRIAMMQDFLVRCTICGDYFYTTNRII